MIQEKQNQKVDYTVMSDRKCKECGEPLKQNVVNRNKHACLCYVCFKLSKGKKMQNKYSIVDGHKTIIGTINLLDKQRNNRRINNFKRRK